MSELSNLSDQELLAEAGKNHLSPIATALFIGFLIGIILFSVFTNSIGWFTLIPLYFAYKLVKGGERSKAIDQLIKERNLK